jgi:hypothetical protein
MNNISLYRILYYHLPHALRKLRTLALLKLSLTYLQMIMLRLDEEFLEARRLAYMTPQVCYLEKYLQIHFGDNSILIIDVLDVERYALLSGDVRDQVANYLTWVGEDGGIAELGPDGKYTYLVDAVQALGGCDTNDLFLTDQGTILYTSQEMDTCRFVVQCSVAAYDQFSQSITETIKKFRLPGFKFIFQVL